MITGGKSSRVFASATLKGVFTVSRVTEAAVRLGVATAFADRDGVGVGEGAAISGNGVAATSTSGVGVGVATAGSGVAAGVDSGVDRGAGCHPSSPRHRARSSAASPSLLNAFPTAISLSSNDAFCLIR